MSRMNWDRVNREKSMTVSYDYSARMDALEQGVVFGREDLVDEIREERSRWTRAEPVVTRSFANDETNLRRPGESKGQRDERVAAAAGLTVGELRALRQARHRYEARLKTEADRRGIKVKQLRRILAAERTGNQR